MNSDSVREAFEKECFGIVNYRVKWNEEADCYIPSDSGYCQEAHTVNKMYEGFKKGQSFTAASMQEEIDRLKRAVTREIKNTDINQGIIDKLQAEVEALKEKNSQLIESYKTELLKSVNPLFHPHIEGFHAVWLLNDGPPPKPQE